MQLRYDHFSAAVTLFLVCTHGGQHDAELQSLII